MQGWIKLHRKLSDNPLWLSEPFTRAQAWVDLLMIANHSDGFIYVRGNKVEIKRGQIGWSQVKLADRWKWSRGKAMRFLNDLETVQQIVQQKNSVTSIITIVNYEEYQNGEQQIVQQTVQQTDSRQDNRQYTNKNDKNEENENNEREGETPLVEIPSEKRKQTVFEILATTILSPEEKQLYWLKIESNSFLKKRGAQFLPITTNQIRADAEYNKANGWLTPRTNGKYDPQLVNAPQIYS